MMHTEVRSLSTDANSCTSGETGIPDSKVFIRMRREGGRVGTMTRCCHELGEHMRQLNPNFTILRGTVTALLVAIAAVPVAQTVSRSAGRKLPGEMSHMQAVGKAQGVIRALTGANGDMRGAGVILDQDPRGRRFWEVTTKGLLRLNIESKSGALLMYANLARSQDQFKGRGRTGRQRFATEAAWRGYLMAMLRRLGLPATLRIARFAWKRDGQVRDANSAGYVGAAFAGRDGREVAIVNCDPQDGTLMYFGRLR